MTATNPENGTVLFTYNGNHTLATKVDARGWKTVYTYDVQRRVTMTQSYPAGWGGVEDFAARVTYTYDTNAVEPGFTQYGTGRLVSAAYRVGGGSQSHAVTEMYSYTPGGQVASKKVLTDSCWNMVVDPYSDPPATVQACGYMQADTVYGWDGRLVNYSVGGNPVAGGPSFSVATDRDGMSRPVAVTATRPPAPSGAGAWSRVWARNAQYDSGGRLASYETLQYVWPGNYAPYDGYTTRTMGYNVNGQLASEGWSGTSGGVTGSVSYSYGGGANNGQISQVVDSVSGETISYAYDALKRLVSAVSGGWTQTYQYDGFGNLTGRVLNGVPTSIAADAGTNRLVGAGYDAAGNMVSGMGASFAYDGGNRLVSAAAVSGGAEYYGYAPDNKRIYTVKPDGSEEWTLFGARGEELGTFAQSGITGAYVDLQTVPVWFAGRIVGRGSPGSVDGIGAVFPDRLGTERVPGARRKPYGEDAVVGARFATYSKDGFSGLMYADQRWYAGGYGRFTSADRYKSSSASRDPGGWNQYGYTQGDPINRFDPHGTFWCDPEIDDTCYDPCDDSIGGFSPSCGGGGGGTNPPPVEPDPPVVDPGPECATLEISYLSRYLSKYGSPLAAQAQRIFEDSQAQGLDDRFIVALAGVESRYGTTQRPATWGAYNAFSNAAHCATLDNPHCYKVNPYTGFGAAIDDVTTLIGSSPLYQGKNSTSEIYALYETGNANTPSASTPILDQIYGSQLGGKIANVRQVRCP